MSLDKSLRRDLSDHAVKRAVLQQVIQSPLTVYSVTAALLGLGYAVIVDTSIMALSVACLAAIIGATSTAWEYVVRGEHHANRFIQRYRALLNARRNASVQALNTLLREAGFERGSEQLDAFRNKFDTFVSVLNTKLNPEELTYNRYLSIAEQVFLGGLDNLERAALALKSVGAIQADKIRTIVEHGQASADVHSQGHIEQLKTRLALYDSQHDKVRQLMLENEAALTQLDLVTTRIADINTQQGRAHIDLEEAMAELRHLIDRADHYSG